jgi:hypothetical protein
MEKAQIHQKILNRAHVLLIQHTIQKDKSETLKVSKRQHPREQERVSALEGRFTAQIGVPSLARSRVIFNVIFLNFC